jgi:S-methylmethionine-dependent homocysteine/selenocysteine methylase
MARYRHALPQLGGDFFLSDGGIETTLIFHEGLELPDFAAFHLLRTPEGEAALLKYFRTYADLARRHRTGLVLESATWRASRDWGARLGYDAGALADANRRAVRAPRRDRHRPRARRRHGRGERLRRAARRRLRARGDHVGRRGRGRITAR